MSERNFKVRLASLVCEHCHGSRPACPGCDGAGVQYELVATSQDVVPVPDDEPCGDEIG